MSKTRPDLKSSLLKMPTSSSSSDTSGAIIQNPIKVLRTNAGYSQFLLAEYAEVSRNVVIRNENGTYESPSPSILEVFFPPGSPQEFNIIEEYHHWQTLMRRANYGLLDPNVSFANCPEHRHPFTYWRAIYNGHATASPRIPANTVSTAFCINQAVLSRLETQPNLIQSLPESLTSALLDAGYSQLLIHEFELAYQRYKLWRHNFALGRNRDLGSAQPQIY